MRCILAAGGTGGHIQPAIALAIDLRELREGAEVLFIGGNRAQERVWIEGAGFEFRNVQSAPLSGNLSQRAMVPARMMAGTLQCLKIMRNFKPDVVIGFGGYTSLPPLLASRILRVPSALLEQNVLPGRTNRLLSRIATEVHSQWEEARPYFPPRTRFHHSGNPVKRAILQGVRGADLRGRCLLVMGGSQGSEAINRLMLGAAATLGDRLPGLEVIHLSGPSLAGELLRAYRGAGIEAEVHEYLEDMVPVYRRADLAICRAGGTSIAELMAIGLPAILIPYPFAADDHQTRNASAVAERGAGFCLKEETTDASTLADLVCDLLGDAGKLEALRGKTLALAIPDAGERILDHLSSLVGSVRN